LLKILISDCFIVLVYCVLLMHNWFSMKEWHDKSCYNIWAALTMNT
jgi:hypothetical protein